MHKDKIMNHRETSLNNKIEDNQEIEGKEEDRMRMETGRRIQTTDVKTDRQIIAEFIKIR